MGLFGSPQTAQIIMQGVQLLNNTLAQAAQVRAQKEEHDRLYALKTEELEAQRRRIEAEAKTNELDFQIKTLSAKKAEIEAASAAQSYAGQAERDALSRDKLAAETQLKQLELQSAKDGKPSDPTKALRAKVLEIDERLKQGDLAAQQRKQTHLTVAKDDPNPLMRRFESVSELSDHRDSLSRSLNEPFLDPARRTEIQRELSTADASLNYRLDRLGKEFGEGRADAVKPMLQTSSTPQTAPQESAAVAAQSAVSPSVPLNVKQLVLDKSPASTQQLKSMLLQNKAAGADQLRKYMAELLDAAPGANAQEKTTYVRNLLKN